MLTTTLDRRRFLRDFLSGMTREQAIEQVKGLYQEMQAERNVADRMSISAVRKAVIVSFGLTKQELKKK